MTSSDPLIKFPCHCGHRFALPADQAAALIQCPKCGRLNDVPTLSDLESISSDDGTLLMKPPAAKPEPNRVADVNRHFRPRRVDDAGNEIDLRNTHEDLANIGAPAEPDEIPLADEDVRPAKPKYDPVTGELIRPITIAKRPDLEQAAKSVPVAARALTYAAGELAVIMSPRRVLGELLFPINMAVMLFVLVLHVINQMVTFALLGGLFLLAPVALVLTVLILAHYGNTIDETGPEQRDELPRPIRGVSFSEDIWTPFCHFAGALILCYFPAFFVLVRSNLPPVTVHVIAGLAALAGSIVFPAVLLTLCTSGTLNNLRPDRVLGSIRVAGWQYVVSVIAWLLMIAAYLAAMTGSLGFIYRLFAPPGAESKFLSHPALVYPLLLIAIYVAHFFCWHLGLMYRAHHANFPWVLQRHVSTRAKAELAQAAEIRARRRPARKVKPGD